MLVYFAYAGVELAVLPAGEIVRPAQTLPRAILLGVAFSTVCYLLVSAVTVSVVSSAALAQSGAPLALAAETLARGLGLAAPLAGLLMTAGALLSIVGATGVISSRYASPA